MNLLDENFPDDQRELLRNFGVAVRQVGRDVGRYGMADEEIVPLLHRFRGVTFLTHDRDFSDASACHPNYCLVWLGVKQDLLADCARRLLRHPEFDTVIKRMGKVLAVGPSGNFCTTMLFCPVGNCSAILFLKWSWMSCPA